MLFMPHTKFDGGPLSSVVRKPDAMSVTSCSVRSSELKVAAVCDVLLLVRGFAKGCLRLLSSAAGPVVQPAVWGGIFVIVVLGALASSLPFIGSWFAGLETDSLGHMFEINS